MTTDPMPPNRHVVVHRIREKTSTPDLDRPIVASVDPVT